MLKRHRWFFQFFHYSWHTIKIHNTVIRHLYTLWNSHPDKSSTHVTPHIVITILLTIFFCYTSHQDIGGLLIKIIFYRGTCSQNPKFNLLTHSAITKGYFSNLVWGFKLRKKASKSSRPGAKEIPGAVSIQRLLQWLTILGLWDSPEHRAFGAKNRTVPGKWVCIPSIQDEGKTSNRNWAHMEEDLLLETEQELHCRSQNARSHSKVFLPSGLDAMSPEY